MLGAGKNRRSDFGSTWRHENRRLCNSLRASALLPPLLSRPAGRAVVGHTGNPRRRRHLFLPRMMATLISSRLETRWSNEMRASLQKRACVDVYQGAQVCRAPERWGSAAAGGAHIWLVRANVRLGEQSRLQVIPRAVGGAAELACIRERWSTTGRMWRCAQSHPVHWISTEEI